MMTQEKEIKVMQHLDLAYLVMEKQKEAIKNYDEVKDLNIMSAEVGEYLLYYSSVSSILFGAFKEISQETGARHFEDYFQNNSNALLLRELRNILIHIGISSLHVMPKLSLDINFDEGSVKSRTEVTIGVEPIRDYLTNKCRQPQDKKDLIEDMLNGKNTIAIHDVIKEHNQKIFEMSQQVNQNYCSINWTSFQ